ncbi:hypothetical protein J6590_034045 [Homalodisca vitripennis]|nr:hypothetical protein J6590_034045 [Homalodisca vitripennis]
MELFLESFTLICNIRGQGRWRFNHCADLSSAARQVYQPDLKERQLIHTRSLPPPPSAAVNLLCTFDSPPDAPHFGGEGGMDALLLPRQTEVQHQSLTQLGGSSRVRWLLSFGYIRESI